MGRFASSKETGYTYNKVVSFEVTHIKEGRYGLTFTLILNEVSINGCKVGETRDGKEFISLPKYKGTDGKYYNHVFFRFTDEDTEKILKALEDALRVK